MMTETMEDTTVRQALIKRLYLEAFPDAARYIGRNGGSLDDTRDIFHDALVAYYEKTRDNNFIPDRSEKAYLLGMVRNLWHKKLERHNGRFTSGKGLENLEEKTQAEISSSRLMRFLEHSGKKCMELLQAVYYEKLSMKTLSERFGFASERSATVQKFKCLEKVRDSVKEKSLTYEDFYE